jgi:hypothetical protein
MALTPFRWPLIARLYDAATAPLWGEHFDRDAEAAVLAAGFVIERREWLWRDWVVLLVARYASEDGTGADSRSEYEIPGTGTDDGGSAEIRSTAPVSTS